VSSIRLPFFWLFFFVEKKLLCPLDCVFYHHSFYIVLVMFGQVARGQKKTKFGQKLQKVHQYSVCIFCLFVFFCGKKTLSVRSIACSRYKNFANTPFAFSFFCWFFFRGKKILCPLDCVLLNSSQLFSSGLHHN